MLAAPCPVVSQRPERDVWTEERGSVCSTSSRTICSCVVMVSLRRRAGALGQWARADERVPHPLGCAGKRLVLNE
jgi:hypothetical protein